MANWNLYDKFREHQNDGGNVNCDTPGGNGFKVALVTATTPDQNLDEFFDDIITEVSGTNYTAGGNVCANPALTLDGSGGVKFDSDDPATWAQSGSGFSTARRAILYRDSGVAATSELVAYSDDFGADRGNVAGAFSVELDAAGIWTSAR